MLFQLGFGLSVLLLSAGSAWAGVTAVPEPASMALLGTGVGALAIYRLRRRK